MIGQESLHRGTQFRVVPARPIQERGSFLRRRPFHAARNNSRRDRTALGLGVVMVVSVQ